MVPLFVATRHLIDYLSIPGLLVGGAEHISFFDDILLTVVGESGIKDDVRKKMYD